MYLLDFIDYILLYIYNVICLFSYQKQIILSRKNPGWVLAKQKCPQGTGEDTHGAEVVAEMASGKDGGNRLISEGGIIGIIWQSVPFRLRICIKGVYSIPAVPD